MQEAAIQIYGEGRNKVYEKELKRLKNWKISAKNKEFITQFHNYLFSTGTGDLRVSKVSSQLRRIALILNKDFDKATIQDIQSIIAYYNRQESYSEATKADYRRSIKQFYAWQKEDDSRIYSKNEEERIRAIKFYKFLEKDISISYKPKVADPSTIITEEEIDVVISAGCRTFKEKAFIKFLHETGVRTGELLTLKIKNIVIRENYAKVTVDGKTGMREIPIVRSIPYLTSWLELHPYKNNENAYLWLGENPKIMWEPLKHTGAQRLLDRCFGRAGVKKKHNLHWFRHSRATLLAPYMTEALLCKYMGWIPGSRQVKVYIHLCNQQLDEAYLKLNGLMAEEQQTQNKPKKCFCGAVNDRIGRYCFKCGRPLSVEIAIQDQELVKEETNKSIKLLMEISQNPELMKQFLEFKKRINENDVQEGNHQIQW